MVAKMNYKVVWLIDNTFQVRDENDNLPENAVFQGSISDCNAYIQLYEKGYLQHEEWEDEI